MSSLKKPIDYKMLENELDEALKADELYKLQNDAKLRAIEQRVPTYDHFYNMVQAAHLRPLERSEMKKKAEVSWNHCFNKNEEALLQAHNTSNILNSKSSNDSLIKKPQTNAEFLRIWNNLSDCKLKFEYLIEFREYLLKKFFHVEVPTEFLQEFFHVTIEICATDNVADVIELLQIFSKCNRLSLSLAMMTEKSLIKLLFERILVLMRDDTAIDSIKELEQIYLISLEKHSLNNKT
ncbi:PREDICTED: coiled-coil domain-containing protein 103 [Ceratosolen solmsi marchali]|uniref:Coiled-coil domain-containing protein 103 n=1 Tax=Ceratosolen solmsi marchali TaxID=326594 RepID=A0AAJ6YL91_9HYME|nr:PREDICTED: coiled-coil domain-containing protein 103 [Ceratosolen solmsi marchali]